MSQDTFLEYEQLLTLTTVTGVERFGVDALGHTLWVLCSTPASSFPMGLTRAGAKELRDALDVILSNTNSEAMSKQ